jgi:hypothetical protein
MLENLSKTIEYYFKNSVPNERKEVLQPLIDYIQNKVNSNEEIRLNLFVRTIPEEVICRKFGHKLWLFISEFKMCFAILVERKPQRCFQK